jgi:hypothetical protein
VTALRPIASFLLTAVVVSIALAYVGAFVSWADDLSLPSPFELLFGPLVAVPFYALFVSVGGLVFGFPALLGLRKLGLARSRARLVAAGTSVGVVAASVILLGWLGLVAVPIIVALGGVGGGLAAALWYELEEKRKVHD